MRVFIDGDLAPSCGGHGKIFRGTNFRMTLFLQKKSILRKRISDDFLIKENSFISPFLVTNSYFPAHPLTLLLQILGDDAWAVPHLKFWDGRPFAPLYIVSLRPCVYFVNSSEQMNLKSAFMVMGTLIKTQ